MFVETTSVIPTRSRPDPARTVSGNLTAHAQGADKKVETGPLVSTTFNCWPTPSAASPESSQLAARHVENGVPPLLAGPPRSRSPAPRRGTPGSVEGVERHRLDSETFVFGDTGDAT